MLSFDFFVFMSMIAGTSTCVTTLIVITCASFSVLTCFLRWLQGFFSFIDFRSSTMYRNPTMLLHITMLEIHVSLRMSPIIKETSVT